jgi:phytol kinase
MTDQDWRNLALVPVALLAGMGLLLILRRRQLLGPEPLRKTVHVGIGGAALALPWLFETAMAVWLVACLCMLAFAYLRTKWSFLGPILQEVDRPSWGEMAWAVAVALCFQLRQGTTDYLAAVLILTLADPAAALVGKRWGRHKFATIGGEKSLEGSGACFLTALAILGIGTLAGWGLPLAFILGIAAAVTMLEAGLGWGGDNLAVPLCVLLLWPG